VSLLRKTGLRLWEARALSLLASAYRAAGDPEASVRHEADAGTLLSAMGLDVPSN